MDWPQDSTSCTTSLKYKAQRERRVPNSSHILFNGEQTQEIIRYLGIKKVQIYA